MTRDQFAEEIKDKTIDHLVFAGQDAWIVVCKDGSEYMIEAYKAGNNKPALGVWSVEGDKQEATT